MHSQYAVINKLFNFAECYLEAPSPQSPAESISRTSPRTVADEINIDFPSSSLFVRPVMPLDDYSKSTSVDVSQQSTSDQEPFSIKLDNLSKSGTGKKLFEVKTS